MSSRDPFPSPKLENEFSLSGFRPQLRQTCKKPTHLAQTEEPWSRLYDRATLASTRRSVMSDERQAPNDSLDFHLKSVYDHDKDLFYKKNQTLYQKESVSEDHGKHENVKSAEDRREKHHRVGRPTEALGSQHQVKN